MIAHHMSLDYTIAAGWLGPFIEGLHAGRAVARKCDACARVSFPPVRVCDCGAHNGTWHDLPGDAVITRRADGSDGDFALVRFSGADTQTVVRLEGFSDTNATGTLGASQGDTPQLRLIPAGSDIT